MSRQNNRAASSAFNTSSGEGVQLSLFHVAKAYEDLGGPVSNENLFGQVANIAGFDRGEFDVKTEVGASGQPHSLLKRKVRWYQQTLKHMGLLTRKDRGVWEFNFDKSDVATKQVKGLTVAQPGQFALAYCTKHGFAIWGDAVSFLNAYKGDPLHLTITSPPYPLRNQRRYADNSLSGINAWLDFMIASLEPLVKNLHATGSIAINIGTDIFESGTPALSIYQEKMVVMLYEKLGLFKMQHIPWINPSKPPGPTLWACRHKTDGVAGRRTQLCTGWESIYVFSPDPGQWGADNNRVLQPHSLSHLRLLENGSARKTNYGDGTHKLRPGKSYSNKTDGKIPKNYIVAGHNCPDTKTAHKVADEIGLPRHGAQFPTKLPEFLIDWLCPEGGTVIDLFSGTNKVGLAAERKGISWISVERVLEYIHLQKGIFDHHSYI